MRKDNMGWGRKNTRNLHGWGINTNFVSKEWPGRRNHECLPSADMTERESCPGRPLVPRSLLPTNSCLSAWRMAMGGKR
jgi:hypothetical protein